jgi:hypothetical protein
VAIQQKNAAHPIVEAIEPVAADLVRLLKMAFPLFDLFATWTKVDESLE